MMQNGKMYMFKIEITEQVNGEMFKYVPKNVKRMILKKEN